MRRRFGRRRSREEVHGVDASWLERAVAAGALELSGLEPVGADDVPASLAALALGRDAAGRRGLLAVAPHDAGDALFAAVAVGLRLHEQAALEGRVIAVAPHWSAEARRALGRLRGLPFELEAIEAPGLAAGARVEPLAPPTRGLVPLAAWRQTAAGAGERVLVARAEEALRGLAAKHGGALRAFGSALELVVLARRVAALRAAPEGLVLEIQLPRRESETLGADSLPDAFDRLEGVLRKHLGDRRVQGGEEGLRGRVVAGVGASGELRSLVRWPLGGAEPDVLDFVALDREGTPVIGAVRRRLGLVDLRGIARAGVELEPFLPGLLADAEPPVRLGPPRLWLAVAELDTAARHLLRHFSEDLACLEVRDTGRTPALRPLELGTPSAPAPRAETERAPARPAERAEPYLPEPARGETRPPAGLAAQAPPSATRPREEDREAERRDQAPEVPARGARSGFEEVSLFELDDEAGRDESGRRRRRRRGRGRRGGRDGREGAEPGEGRGETARREGGAEAQGRTARSPGPDAGRVCREPPPRDEPEVAEEEIADEEGFVPLVEAPEFELEPAAAYEEDDEDATAGAEPRERQGRTRGVKLEPEPEPEAAAAPRPLRRRTAIVAHADRDAVAAALLLAREVRLLEGVWVYRQAELMTFFRSVATDLREDAGIAVIGFTPSPARDVLQAAALYRGRLQWFDHHDWPPEDLSGLCAALGEDAVHRLPGSESNLAAVLGLCARRSRFSDKLVDLARGRFSQHDYERWGSLWWWRLGEVVRRGGERRAELEALLVGRPSDLAREAAGASPAPTPPEAAFAAQRDFRLVHFGGYSLVVVPVPAELDLYLAARIVRERYGAPLSLAHPEGGHAELVVLGSEDGSSRRELDVHAMVEHLAWKFPWLEALSNADHIARVRVRDLARQPERFEELLAEIAMGRSILER